MQKSIREIEPQPNKPCLCGSGKLFGKCCKNLYQDSPTSCGHLSELITTNPVKALDGYRAWLTWYRLCHVAHTVPFLDGAAFPTLPADIMEIDIEAMKGIVERVVECYVVLKKKEHIDSFLVAQASAIEDERWTQYIKLQRAVAFAIHNGEPEPAERILRTTFDIDHTSDVDVLTLYFDVASGHLNGVEKIEFAEKIARLATQPGVILQYKMAAAIQRRLLTDDEKYDCVMRTIIEGALAAPNAGADEYFDFMLARSMVVYTEFSGDSHFYEQCTSLLDKQLENDRLSILGRTEALRNKASLLYAIGKINEAREAYSEIAQLGKFIDRINLAKTLVDAGHSGDAISILNEINPRDLKEPGNYEDFVIAYTLAATATKNDRAVSKAETLLETWQPDEPTFASIKSSLEKRVLRSLDGRSAGGEEDILILQPNIWGFGINLNAMFRRIVRERDK